MFSTSRYSTACGSFRSHAARTRNSTVGNPAGLTGRIKSRAAHGSPDVPNVLSFDRRTTSSDGQRGCDDPKASDRDGEEIK
ncbi:Hypothetical protein NTJ_06009 [Nesidiocoris tenuis]|uniref:Uncharacterized protein n=1 Tax=Nesidiocoris tenuis TaxID=355587 RepID=A0ABN7ALU1_9HEMI|nr:Hypothetical protein NTJ_06009 [Nesidiocoris tenuis]